MAGYDGRQQKRDLRTGAGQKPGPGLGRLQRQAHWHQRRDLAHDAQAVRHQAISQAQRAAMQATTAAAALGAVDKVKGGLDHRGVDRRKRCPMFLARAQGVGQCRIPQGDKSTGGRKGLGEAAEHDVDPAKATLKLQNATTFLAEGAKVMRDIGDQERPMLPRKLGEFGQVGHSRGMGRNRRHRDEDPAPVLLPTKPGQPTFQSFE